MANYETTATTSQLVTSWFAYLVGEFPSILMGEDEMILTLAWPLSCVIVRR